MAIDPNIKQKAENIRLKKKGREVRESLAAGLEAMSEDVVENSGRQDYVEQQLQAVHDSTRGKDVISATEILASQVGADGTQYRNMKERLDAEQNKVNAQLAHMKKYSKPKFFYSVDDMINDNSLKIGDICYTLGYYAPNDNGNAMYTIKSESMDIYEPLINGLFAELNHSGKIKVEKIGVVKNNSGSKIVNTTILQKYFDSFMYEWSFSNGIYHVGKITLSNITTLYLRGMQERGFGDKTIVSQIYTDGDDFVTSTKTELIVYVNNLHIKSKAHLGYGFSSSPTGGAYLNGENIILDSFKYGFYSAGESSSQILNNLTLKNNEYGYWTDGIGHFSTVNRLNLDGNKYGMKLTGNTVSVSQVHLTPTYNGTLQPDEKIVGIRISTGMSLDGLYVEGYGMDVTNSILLDYYGNVRGVSPESCYLSRINFPLSGDIAPSFAYIRMNSLSTVTNKYWDKNRIIITNSYVGDLKIDSVGDLFIRGIKVNGHNTWNTKSSAGFNNFEIEVKSNTALNEVTREFWGNTIQAFTYGPEAITNYTKMVNPNKNFETAKIYNSDYKNIVVLDANEYNVSLVLYGEDITAGTYTVGGVYRDKENLFENYFEMGTAVVSGNKRLNVTLSKILPISGGMPLQIGFVKEKGEFPAEDFSKLKLYLKVTPLQQN